MQDFGLKGKHKRRDTKAIQKHLMPQDTENIQFIYHLGLIILVKH